MLPIQKAINLNLLAFFGGDCQIINNHRDLLELNPSNGGLGIASVSKESSRQYMASKKITENHVNSIIHQNRFMIETNSDGKSSDELRAETRNQLRKEKLEQITTIHNKLTGDTKNYVKQACDKGASSWLTTLPLKDQNLDLNKAEFTDALRMRYNETLNDLPSFCPCGKTFDMKHAMNCKKGGFVSGRHDNIRDLLTVCLDKVCCDVEAEPHLTKVTNERFKLKSANVSDEARLDIKARGFWRKGETAFFDVRVTHVNSNSSKNLSTSEMFHRHEQSKKREYLERVLEVEHASFTPLVFGTNGGVGEECSKFLKNLSRKLSLKNDENYSDVLCWLRTRLSMEITRSSLLCLRGSRTPFRGCNADDIGLQNVCSGLV